jgi:hypothetical protein
MNVPLLLLNALLATGDVTSLPPGGRHVVTLPGVKAGETYGVQVSLGGAIGSPDRARVAISGPGEWQSSKVLHEGDPDVFVPFRPTVDGEVRLEIVAEPSSGPVSVRTNWA